MNEIKVLEELLEIIWGAEPKKKKPRNAKGRFIKRSKVGSSK
jgi:hypothetical protein|tara:strand:+ start:121 stop:246 length:126 start_codon:yes stop_codon:yes gene_type:complete